MQAKPPRPARPSVPAAIRPAAGLAGAQHQRRTMLAQQLAQRLHRRAEHRGKLGADDPVPGYSTAVQRAHGFPARVDGGAADADRQAGADHRLAADVAAGGALGVAAADEGVLDQGGVDAAALDRGAHRVGGQGRPGDQVEFAALRLGDGRAGGGDDDGFAHIGFR